ncbi:MAG: hypothetical protein PHE02_05045 [Lachnospiraceae bacterium]|nr:hypothetical protein [Lachnospiraceae bacterium]
MHHKIHTRKILFSLIQLVTLLIGLVIAHLGVTLFIQTNLGSDPFNVFVQGSFRTLTKVASVNWLTHGYTHISISLCIILMLLVIDRSYIKIGTLICMALGGPIIDIFTTLLKDSINASMPFPLRVLTLCCGCIILAFGMTIVINSDAGTGPNDLVAIVISDKIKRPFSMIRILVDAAFVVVGFLLGGTFGIGTIICAFLVGPVAGFFLPHTKKVILKIYQKTSLPTT